MPRTKLDDLVKPEKKPFSLEDIPTLSTTLTIQRASEVAGIGYQSIRNMIKSGKLTAIQCDGKKYVLPTWTFIIETNILPEPVLEKVYMNWIDKSA